METLYTDLSYKNKCMFNRCVDIIGYEHTFVIIENINDNHRISKALELVIRKHTQREHILKTYRQKNK